MAQNGRAAPRGPHLHAVEHGGAGRRVVLVHGLGGNTAHWGTLPGLLAADHRVSAVDLPGFGRSPTAGRGTVHDLAAALAAHLRRTSVGAGPAVLVGNSLGGLVTLLVAHGWPELVAGVVPVAPAVPRSRHHVVDDEVAATFGAYATPLGYRALRARWGRLGPDGLVDETLRLCVVTPEMVAPGVRAAIVDELAATIARPEAAVAYLRAVRSLASVTLRRGRFHQWAREVTVPTMVVQGERDRLVLLDAVEDVVRRRSGWDLRVLRGIGHVPQLEAPAAVADLVRGFVRTTPDRTARQDTRSAAHAAARTV